MVTQTPINAQSVLPATVLAALRASLPSTSSARALTVKYPLGFLPAHAVAIGWRGCNGCRHELGAADRGRRDSPAGCGPTWRGRSP